MPSRVTRFRAIKTKDHSAPGHYSWIVFDGAQPDNEKAMTYLADCISAKGAKLVADALNFYFCDAMRSKRMASQKHGRAGKSR